MGKIIIQTPAEQKALIKCAVKHTKRVAYEEKFGKIADFLTTAEQQAWALDLIADAFQAGYLTAKIRNPVANGNAELRRILLAMRAGQYMTMARGVDAALVALDNGGVDPVQEAYLADGGTVRDA